MQIAETLNEGLKRAYTLTIPASDIAGRVDAEIKRVAPQVRMPGFRPGKVPANLIRKMHGPALQQEALNSAIQEGIQKLIADKELRPATQPSVELDEGYEAGGDAALKVALEVLPKIDTPSVDGLKLERLVVPVDDAEVDEQLNQLVKSQTRYEDAADGHAAASGDNVVMDFAGKVDGEAFDGGTGTDMAVVIGSGRLIPGFEDQLVGAKVGDARTIEVTFPADYGAKELAGKPATFDITVTKVQTAADTAADDDFAKSLGLEGIDKLRELVKGQIEQQHNGLTRTHMKRKLLDQLADAHSFDVPPSMVEGEFQQIWSQLEQEAAQEADPDAARAEMEAERADYQKIAERRVRLGLLLSEIGQANGVEITQAEMQRLIVQAAQQYPADQRQRFFEYVQSEPMAAAQLRAPLYEEKVVDFLFGKAEISEREVTREALQAAIEDVEGGHVHGPDCNHDHDHDHGHAHGHEHAAKPAKAAKAKPAAQDAAADADAPAKPAKKKAAAQPVEGDAEVKPAKPAKKKAAPADTPAAEEAPAKPKRTPRAKAEG